MLFDGFGSLLPGALITALAEPVPAPAPLPEFGILTVMLTGGALPCGMVSRVQSTVLASRVQVQPSPLGPSSTSAPGGRLMVITGFFTVSGPPFDASATITTGSVSYTHLSNTYGTGLGAVLSITTPAGPPTVSTDPPTGIATNLNGSANPNGSAATGWFRIATSSPGACNDTFGTRVPAAAGTALGAGSGVVAFSNPASGLVPGTTYYLSLIHILLVVKALMAVGHQTPMSKYRA